MASVILKIARTLHLEVVAEGVEHPEQEQPLRDIGCDYAQGFHLGKPLTAHAAAALGQGDVHPNGATDAPPVDRRLT